MKRQKVRKLLIIVSMLLFPVTLYYFSPALIINGAFNHVINGSFIVFLLMLVLSIPFGRLFCGYLCPAGGIQQCAALINDKRPKQGWKNYIKYVIWAVWIALVIYCYIRGGKIEKVNFFYETEHGISVSSIQSYVIYYGIVCLIFIPSVLCGKRTFCHYFCWMAPFMVIGTKVSRFLHLPGVHIKKKESKNCISCGMCNKVCPMGLDVMNEIKNGQVKNLECIQCGACVDHCSKDVLAYGFTERRTKENGNGKEA